MEEREKDIITQKKAEDEIDIVEIIQKLWRNRRFILKITAVFAVLGIIVAISTPNVYTASCTMVPQTGQKSAGGSLGGLAAMAGINIGNLSSGEVLSPSVYPKIMTNINFQKELIYSKFHFKGVSEPITLYDYYSNKKYQKFNLLGAIKTYTIGLPWVLINLFSNSNRIRPQLSSDYTTILYFTSAEHSVSNIAKSILSISVDNRQGTIILTSKMNDPVTSAELAQKGVELLQKYITKFKIEKVSINLEFIEKSYEEAKRNFETKQAELAKYRDSNKSFTSAVAKTQEEKLTSEYNLLLGIYTELAKQKEQAKIEVTETIPILTVIEPVTIPIDKSEPNRLMLLILYTLFGLIIGLGIVISISYLESNLFPSLKNNRFIPKIN